MILKSTTRLAFVFVAFASITYGQLPLTYADKPNPHNKGLNAEQECTTCHSLEAVNALIHPMHNLNPQNTQISIPDHFPLTSNGDMSCMTCHESVEKQTRSNRSFLRGGPYRQELDFCYNCHERQNYEKINPHQQLSEDGSINSAVCLNCHVRQPSADDHPTIAAEMQTEMKMTCNKCHALHTHEENHYGRNLKTSKTATLKQYDATQAQYGITLPLSQNDEIQCHTCHYIHGSLGIDAVIYEGSDENQYFLRLPKERLCYACHNL